MAKYKCDFCNGDPCILDIGNTYVEPCFCPLSDERPEWRLIEND